MFQSKKKSKLETLARSDSEIEVDFVCHQKPQKSEVSSSTHSKRQARKSFSSSTHLDSNSQEDTDGSSIIDLRNKKRWSRSLDQLDDSSASDKESKNDGCKTGSRSLRKSHIKDNYMFEQRMSFHTSLQDLSSDDQQSKGSRKQSHREMHRSISKAKSDSQSKFAADEWEKDSDQKDYQIFMKKSPSYTEGNFDQKEKDPTPDSPETSPRSSLCLIPSKETQNGLKQQITVSVSASLAPLACGFAIGFAITKNPNNYLSASHKEWLQHIFIIGAIFGAVLSGVVSNYGRRIPMFITISLLLIGWLSLIFSVQVWMVLLFYWICGLCTSLTLVLAQLYIAEISTPKIRGALSSTPLIALHVGLLISFVFEPMFTWKNFAIIGVSFIAPFYIMVVLCMPESPRYLIRTNPNEALAMLQWLRGFTSDVMKEYKDIADNCFSNKWCLDRYELKRPGFWRPLIISSVLMFLFSMSGVASIIFYGKSLFKDMSLTYPNLSFIIVLMIILVGLSVSSILVDQIGRKLLLLLSLTIMAASAFTLGLFLFLKDIHKLETYFAYQWTAEIFCIILFTIAHGTAVAPITWLTLGETFGTRLKWLGVSVSSTTLWLSMLLVDLSYTKITIVIATGGLFWFHCIICVGGYIFILLFFRELRNQKIDDVAKIFLINSENLIDTFITKI